MKILMVTCDKYSWCVPDSVEFLVRSKIPYPITVLTNTVKLCHPDTVYTGEDEGWSGNILKYLKDNKETEPFILWLENAICSEINPYLLQMAVVASTRNNVGMVRLYQVPGPLKYYDSDLGMDIGMVDKTLPNVVSCQSSIWKPSVLQDLLREGETAWDFEFQGTERARLHPSIFLGTYGYAVRYGDLVVRGKVDKNVQNWIDFVRKEHPLD